MRRGFPRPRLRVQRFDDHTGDYSTKEYPVPYNAEEDHIARIDTGRLFESVFFRRCGTCGEPVKENLVGLILYNEESDIARPSIEINSGDIFNSESGPYHLKCLALNFAMCPHLATTDEFIPACGEWSDVGHDIGMAYKRAYGT